MVIIKISGGLGNQLFQYSFGKFLSLHFNTELKLDIYTEGNHSSFTNREFGLNHFNIASSPATYNELVKMKHFTSGIFERIERKVTQTFPNINKSYYVEKSYDFDHNIKKIRNDCYYDGYWQSEKYFMPIKQSIKKDLEFNVSLSDSNIEILNNIITQKSVSIHIRRSDYINNSRNKDIFSCCSINYYNSAINLINRHITNTVFYLFSDDIHWARQNFRGERFVFVDNNLSNPEIDLFLMSKCKHNIIANSTFSWWGAWLNSNSCKIVIAPEKWFNGSRNNCIKDLIPNDWIKI